jgi:hypothetical protein
MAANCGLKASRRKVLSIVDAKGGGAHVRKEFSTQTLLNLDQRTIGSIQFLQPRHVDDEARAIKVGIHRLLDLILKESRKADGSNFSRRMNSRFLSNTRAPSSRALSTSIPARVSSTATSSSVRWPIAQWQISGRAKQRRTKGTMKESFRDLPRDITRTRSPGWSDSICRSKVGTLNRAENYMSSLCRPARSV